MVRPIEDASFLQGIAGPVDLGLVPLGHPGTAGGLRQAGQGDAAGGQGKQPGQAAGTTATGRTFGTAHNRVVHG
ncbi:hypothetical protein G6F21_014772 [Rhizopus arrhizus]|nr:hypothetical protein G6F21_014772 [Rhizopus arrhizus]